MADLACQHGSVCRAHFETLRERCEAAEAALEARTQERDEAKADGIAIGRLSGDLLAAELRAAKDAAQARAQALGAALQALRWGVTAKLTALAEQAEQRRREFRHGTDMEAYYQGYRDALIHRIQKGDLLAAHPAPEPE